MTFPHYDLRKLLRMRFTARVGRYFAAALLCAAAAPLALLIDLPAAEWFHQLRLPSEIRRMVQLSEVVAAGGSVLWIAILVCALDRRGLELGSLVACQSLGSGILADLIKLVVARQRPWTILWPNLPSSAIESYSVTETFVSWFPLRNPALLTSAYQSFPSGHTATAVGLATVLSLAYPRGRWIFAILAVHAAFQRMQCTAHFPSDVLAGAAVGFLGAGITDLFGWNWALQEDRKPADQRSDIATYFLGPGPV